MGELPINQRYVVFDFETTGLYPQKGYKIVEIGALAIRGQELHREEFFYSLVNPLLPIPAEVTAVHGITDQMVSGAPLINEILPSFLDFLGNSPLIIQNAPFDLAFLDWELKSLNLPKLNNRVLDLIELSKTVYPYEKRHNLEAICERLGVEIFPPACLSGQEELCRHRAMGDAMLTAQAFLKIRGKLSCF